MTAPHSLHLADGPPSRRLWSGSLCTGYGGLDLAAAAVLGARLAWCAESDRHAAALLAARYPGVPNLGDITALDWAAVPPVDLITAGWPCQDISYSGPGTGSGKEPQWPLAHHRHRSSPPTTPLRLPGKRRRAAHPGPRQSPRRPGRARV